jgi:hypothetical protein
MRVGYAALIFCFPSPFVNTLYMLISFLTMSEELFPALAGDIANLIAEEFYFPTASHQSKKAAKLASKGSSPSIDNTSPLTPLMILLQ